MRCAWIGGAALLALASVSDAQRGSPPSGRKETPLAQDSLYRLTTYKSGVKPEDAGLRKDIEAALR